MDLIQWAHFKRLGAREKAKEESIDLVLDDDASEDESE